MLEKNNIGNTGQINTLDTNLKSGFYMAMMLEAGFALEQLVAVRDNSGRYNIGKEILSLGVNEPFPNYTSFDNNIKNSYIYTNRRSIYDAQAEGLFHSLQHSTEATTKDEMLSHIKKQRKDEQGVRRFFSLFEREFDRWAAVFNFEELKYYKEHKYEEHIELIGVIYPFIKIMPADMALRFIDIIPNINLIRSSIVQTQQAFSFIFSIPITISPCYNSREVKVKKRHRLKHTTLGINAILVGKYRDSNASYVLTVTPSKKTCLSTLLDGGELKIVLDKLIDLFFCAMSSVKIEIDIGHDRAKAHLGELEMQGLSYLGINTYL